MQPFMATSTCRIWLAIKAFLLWGGDESKGLTVVSNGSAGVSAKRRPGEERNTYCVFTFSTEGVHLRMRELRSDSKSGSDIFDGDLGASPAVPK